MDTSHTDRSHDYVYGFPSTFTDSHRHTPTVCYAFDDRVYFSRRANVLNRV